MASHSPKTSEDADRALLDRSDMEQHMAFTRRPSAGRRWVNVALSAAVIVLLASNVATYLYAKDQKSRLPHDGYTGISSLGERWSPFHTWTRWSDPSTADATWDAFDTNGFVALSHTWAAEQHLPAAEDFPDDPTKGVYVIDGFHQMHCLIYLRTTLQTLYSGTAPTAPWYHVEHCFDYLRQATQCRADDTPMYLAPNNNLTAGDGQLRRCRDWSALQTFAKEHDACWPTGRCADRGKESVNELELEHGRGGSTGHHG